MTRSKMILFHVPYELKAEARIAPQIRPRRMIAAFEQIGYEVTVVAGDPGERRRRMREVRRQIIRGTVQIDFVYSESAGWPNAFSDEGRSFHPNLDASFLKFLNRRGIAVALFYRDAYHRSEDFFDAPFLRRVRRHILRIFASHDLRAYNSYLSLLYLPSIQMRRAVPEFRGEVRALPPGSERHPIALKDPRTATTLNLLYVGGLGNLYRIHALFEAVATEPGTKLTVCTREDDWLRVGPEYAAHLKNDRINVVHRSGDALLSLYAETDIAILTVEPNPYREFAVPVKLFEYVGHGKPVVASSGTLAGEYVDAHRLGWVVDYGVETIRSLLRDLTSTGGRADVHAAASRVTEHARAVGWDERARQVVADMDRRSKGSSTMPEHV